MLWIASLFVFANINLLLNVLATTDITFQVFEKDTEILPAAFGDFNSDEITDLFVLRNKSKTIEILLGSNEGTPLLKAADLKCTFNNSPITNVVPGDFNGDALMDVLVTTKNIKNEKNLNVHLLWGSGTSLNCSFNESKPFLTLKGEPLAIDCNRDFIIDLFGVDEYGRRGIWVFNKNSQPVFQSLRSEGKNSYKIRDPHSNAFLDLNNDNIPDLFLTAQNQESYVFEEWYGLLESPYFFFNRLIKPPQDVRYKLGQSVFLDLELKGKLDLVVPVIDKVNPRILVYAHDNWKELNVNFKNENNIWHFMENGLPFSKSVILRGGDYNMDGYPDLLAILTTGNLNRTFLLENVPCSTGCNNFSRSFQINWNGFGNNLNDTAAGVFYDIFQDGILDILLIRKHKNESYFVSAYKNKLNYDGNFFKVMVLTGLSNQNYSKEIGRFKTNKNTFGTNLPGPKVAYKTVDQDGYERTGVSSQLPQSAHFSLNLPYIMFSLGRTPNFVDNITIGFASKHRDLLQVIPNSQMVVIPVKIDNPAKWKVQLFVTPSKIILLSSVALFGTCILIIMIIFFLHWKEKKVDRLERLQEAHRFNFDAM